METNNDCDAELLRAVSWVEHILEQTGGAPGKNYNFINRVIYTYKRIKIDINLVITSHMIVTLTVLGNWSAVDQPPHRVDAVNVNAIDIIAQQEMLPPTLQKTTDSADETPNGQC